MRLLAAVMIVLVTASAVAVSAQSGTRNNQMRIEGCDVGSDVALAGKVILRIRVPSKDYSCRERAEIVQSRITEMLSGPVRKWEIGAREKGGEWGVYADEDLIITADSKSAQINGTNPKMLATIWANNLKSVIYDALPYGYSPAADAWKRKMEREAEKERMRRGS